MLILRRKEGETLLIGDAVTITVLGVDSGGTVNLGVDAPRDVLILRGELKQTADANKDAALGVLPEEILGDIGNMMEFLK